MKSEQLYKALLTVFLTWMTIMPACAWEAAPAHQVDAVEFSFYGQPLHVAKLKTVEVKSVCDWDVSKAWHSYHKQEVSTILDSLRDLATSMGLNDWFVFQLVRHYVDALLGNSSPLDRIVLEHLLLVEMGYDVRLARTQQQLVLMVPFDQEVYEQCFVKINGKDYYLYYDDMDADPDEESVLYPCDPSKNHLGKGHTLSLLFDDKPLKVCSGNEKYCELDDGKIHLACSVDKAVMEMLRYYPMMDIRSYVTSVVLPQFHQSIMEQMKPQLEDLSQCEAANALLHFVQHVFDYENDKDAHGFEKIYFVEENFYYDKNDCEDRSVLYAFLIRSLLDLDVQILEYPGHECTAVRFTDCRTYGSGYYLNGEFYLICDPSYVGAPIGSCMPRYRTMQPQVYAMKAKTMNEAYQPPLKPSINDMITVPELPKILFSL